MQDFSVEGGPQIVWGGSDFSRVERNFTIGQTLKFGVIFQKYALKLIKNWKNIEKIREKCQFFRNFFNFRAGRKFIIM